MKRLLLISGLVLLIVNFTYADILTLKNREKIEGVIMEENETSVKFKEYLGGAGFAISTYQKSEIISIERWTEEENKELIERYEMMQKEWERKQREPQPPITPQEVKQEPIVEPPISHSQRRINQKKRRIIRTTDSKNRREKEGKRGIGKGKKRKV